MRTKIGSDSQKLALDLAGVTLVKREVVSFFGFCVATGIELRNCPSHIRAWTREEQGRLQIAGDPEITKTFVAILRSRMRKTAVLGR